MDIRPVAPRAVRAAMLALALSSCAPAPAAAGGSALGVATPAAQAALASHPLRDLDGGALTLGALRGQVVVVNFWASWCRPCQRELPRLSALHAEIAPLGGRVIAVSIDEEEASARQFARARKLAMPVAVDGPEGLARRLDLRAVPATVVLDRDGTLVYTSRGSDDRALDELAAVTRRLLQGGAQAARADAEEAR